MERMSLQIDGRLSASERPNSERLVAFEVQSSRKILRTRTLVRHEVPVYRNKRRFIPEEKNLQSQP